MFQHDPLDLGALAKQGEEIDPDPGLPCGDNLRPPVTDVHILQRDLHVREKADFHISADAEFHPHHARHGRFKPGLVGVDIEEKTQRDRDKDKQSDECADGIANGFKWF